MLTVQEILDKINSGELGVNEGAQELAKITNSGTLDAVTVAIQSSPELAQAMSKLEAQAKAGALSNKIAAGLNFLGQVGMTGAALQQIANAKKYAQQVVRPSLPPTPGNDPQLQAALGQTPINVNEVLAPARQQINEAAQAGLMNAQNISRGQSGAYSSLANQINLQRMKAGLGLAPMAQEVAAQNAGLKAQLLGLRQQEITNQIASRQANAGLAFDQYNRDAAAVGGLGQSGRNNLATLATQIPDAFRAVASQIVPTTFDKPGFKGTGYKKQGADLSQQVQDFMKNAYAENAMRQSGFTSQDIYPKPAYQTTGSDYEKYNWQYGLGFND